MLNDLRVTAGLKAGLLPSQEPLGDYFEGLGCLAFVLTPCNRRVAAVIDILAVLASLGPRLLQRERRPASEFQSNMLGSELLLEHPRFRSAVANTQAKANDAVRMTAIPIRDLDPAVWDIQPTNFGIGEQWNLHVFPLGRPWAELGRPLQTRLELLLSSVL